MAQQEGSASEVLQLKSEIEYLSKLIRQHKASSLNKKTHHYSRQYNRTNHPYNSQVSFNKKWISSSNSNTAVRPKQSDAVSRHITKTTPRPASQPTPFIHNGHTVNHKLKTTRPSSEGCKNSGDTAVSERTSPQRLVLKPKQKLVPNPHSSRVVLKRDSCPTGKVSQGRSPASQHFTSGAHGSESSKAATISGSGEKLARRHENNCKVVSVSASKDVGKYKWTNNSLCTMPLKRAGVQSTMTSLESSPKYLCSSSPCSVVRRSPDGSKIHSISSDVSSGAQQAKPADLRRTVCLPASGTKVKPSQVATEKCTTSSLMTPTRSGHEPTSFVGCRSHEKPVSPVYVKRTRYKLTRQAVKEKTTNCVEVKRSASRVCDARKETSKYVTTAVRESSQSTVNRTACIRKFGHAPKSAFHWQQSSVTKWSMPVKSAPSKYSWSRKSTNCRSHSSSNNSPSSLRMATIRLNTRYKLVRKAIRISHRKSTKLNHSLSSRYTFVASRPSKRMANNFTSLRMTHSGTGSRSTAWRRKYSLKRNITGYEHVTTRPVHNVSHSKFKFINGGFRGMLQGQKQRYAACYRLTKIDRRSLAQRNTSRTLFVPSRFQHSLKATHYLSVRKSRFVLNRKRPVNPELAKRIINKTAKMERVKDVASRVLQKSVYTAYLAKFKKTSANNEKVYCLYYNRFGKCHRGDQCHYIHDPARIAICTRFLRGRCEVSNCPFSHHVSKEKMPVCQYFIKGVCNRDNCPYLHSNVAKDAEVCDDFIQGFCVLGDQCKKKHILVCPDYKKYGSCSLGKKCKLRHIKQVVKKRKLKESSVCGATKTSRLDMVAEEDLDDVELPLGERKLPSYIPLDLTLDSFNTSQLSDDSSVVIHPRLSLGDEPGSE